MNLPKNLISVNKSFTTDSNVTFQHLDRYNNTIGEHNLGFVFLVIVLCSFIIFGIFLGTILTHNRAFSLYSWSLILILFESGKNLHDLNLYE